MGFSSRAIGDERATAIMTMKLLNNLASNHRGGRTIAVQ